MDKIRFKECINYPLFFSKHPDQLSKPLKAWEKMIGTLAFVALTLLAGSFFYIKGLRVKVTKDVPLPKQAQKVSEVVKPALEPTPKDSPPKPLQNSGSDAEALTPATIPTESKKSAVQDSPHSPVNACVVEALINSLKLTPSSPQTPQAIKELSQCSEEDRKILTKFVTDLEDALHQLKTSNQTSVENDQFKIEAYIDSRELRCYKIYLKIKLHIVSLDDGSVQGTFQFENSGYTFEKISGFSFEWALRTYLSLKYANFEARSSSRAKMRMLVLRPYLKKPASWPEMDETQRKQFEDDLLKLINPSKCEESSRDLIYGQIQKCSAYELQALQVLLSTFEQTFKKYSSNPQEILKGSIKMYPSKNHPNNFEYGNIFTLTTTSCVDPSTAFPIAKIELEEQKFYFETLSTFAIMHLLKGAIPKASKVVNIKTQDETSMDGFSFAIL